MVTIFSPGSIGKCHKNYPSFNTHVASLCKITLISTAISPSISRSPGNNVVHNSDFSRKGYSRLRTHHHHHHVSHRVASNRRLCRSHDTMSPDDEFRSSRNIAISFFRRYRNVIERGGVDNLKEFISAGVNAYALGCTNEGLRKELTALKESGVEAKAMQSYGGSTSVKSKSSAEEVNECILWLSIIFITILCTPQPTIVR